MAVPVSPVSVFADVVVYLAAWGVSWSSGGERIRVLEDVAPEVMRSYDWSAPENAAAVDSPGVMLQGAADLIAFWAMGVKLLALGFGYSFFWTSATAIYLLLRRDTDDAPLDEIAVEEPSTSQPSKLKPSAGNDGGGEQAPTSAVPPTTTEP